MAPVSWPGLLAWSTKYHDGTAPSQFKQMSDEDRAFLQQAFEDAFGQMEDLNEVFHEAIKQLRSEDRTPESTCTALEMIDRVCDDPDVARNAEKLDGIQALLDVAVAEAGPIRSRALEILALLFSNNPNIQQAGVKRGGMDIFLKLFSDAALGSEERLKAFRALVALVRQEAPFEEELLRRRRGAQVIAECLDRGEDPRTHEKALSFTTSLLAAGRLQAEDAEAVGPRLAPLFKDVGQRNIQYQEVLAAAVHSLAEAHKALCPVELSGAIQARLAELQRDGNVDANEQEMATLSECLGMLPKQ